MKPRSTAPWRSFAILNYLPLSERRSLPMDSFQTCTQFRLPHSNPHSASAVAVKMCRSQWTIPNLHAATAAAFKMCRSGNLHSMVATARRRSVAILDYIPPLLLSAFESQGSRARDNALAGERPLGSMPSRANSLLQAALKSAHICCVSCGLCSPSFALPSSAPLLVLTPASRGAI